MGRKAFYAAGEIGAAHLRDGRANLPGYGAVPDLPGNAGETAVVLPLFHHSRTYNTTLESLYPPLPEAEDKMFFAAFPRVEHLG